jgi:hypothetical protein
MPLPYNENMSEALGLAAYLAPVSLSPGTAAIGPLNVQQGKRALFFLQIGAVSSNGTIDFKIQASSVSGANFTDVTGAAITQRTASGIVCVEVKAETLERLSKGKWIKGLVTTATAASLVGGVALVAPTDYSPASGLYSVLAETVVV